MGWLAKLTEDVGAIFSINIEPIDNAQLIEHLDARIRDATSLSKIAKNESIKQVREAEVKDGHQTFIYKLLLARTGINPKKNSAIGELAKNIEIAIEQEKKINEDIHQCKGQITCNIGRIIDEIRNDDGK